MSIRQQCKVTVWSWTNSLVFHACEDDIEHLCERGLGGGLVDEVAAGQVDVVAGPDCQEHRALVNLDVWRSHSRQQGLDRNKRKVMSYQTSCCCSPCWITPRLPFFLWHVKTQTFDSHILLRCIWCRTQLFVGCFDVTQLTSFKIKKIIRKMCTTHWSTNCFYCSKL